MFILRIKHKNIHTRMRACEKFLSQKVYLYGLSYNKKRQNCAFRHSWNEIKRKCRGYEKLICLNPNFEKLKKKE
uniref:Uncharacterized protein n=1 Tax=Meloidogyne enterolobii TaxID=390850 RepID=A0A6V7XZJ8_MELEN|nr:unnamed protein product [Meloidogyne enterolobii]